MFALTEEIQKSIDNANGRRRTRLLDAADIGIFFETLNEVGDDPKVHTVRRYSGEGFVPNSYKYRADISYLEANRDAETGEWRIGANTADAKRSRGNGALTTINGRAAD